jgi:hypothetical protein
MTRLLLVLLTSYVALQFSGGLMSVSRTEPTAICWSLAPGTVRMKGLAHMVAGL